jgi:hypothetical protein
MIHFMFYESKGVFVAVGCIYFGMFGLGSICYDALAYHFFGPELGRAFAGIRSFSYCCTVSLSKVIISNCMKMVFSGKHIIVGLLVMNVVLVVLAQWLKRY